MVTSPPYVSAATLADVPANMQHVIVLAKRTYELSRWGGIVIADQQLPLTEDSNDEEHEDRLVNPPASEMDYWPSKPRTDIVVVGKVHAPGARPAFQMRASVTVGRYGKTIHVHGDRRVMIGPDGRLQFTMEEPFVELPLTYSRAYGGLDLSVPLPEISDMSDLLNALVASNLPGAYPRNPAGTGYIVTGDPGVLHGLALPNFEEPGHPLRPEHLVVRDPALWWRMPLPQGFGWFHPTWYPRCTYAGVIPRFPPRDDVDTFPEVQMQLVPKGQSARLEALELPQRYDPRLANGASPGLAVPHLEGNEPVTLVGLAREGDIRFQLPGERPDVRVFYKRQPLPTTVAMHTLLIEPDARRFSVLWGARAPTPRPLPVRQPTVTNLEVDPLEDVDIFVDGVPCPHAP